MSVFHLKYRPQTLGELDLADVSVKIGKIINSKERPQAYLFTGPKGSGKTSAARIVAKMVNCEKPVGGEPCNKCPNCLEINRSGSMDVIEIDGASNRGIEDIRDLKEKAVLMPVRLKTKVFIIDEVHMLTKEAFNALLKLIEEPPKNTLFILCTTDAQKVPETILSRLVRIDFRKANHDEKLKSLRRVVDGEKLEIDEKILELIIEKSDNSFRNLQKNFNEMVIELENKLDEATVISYLERKRGGYLEENLEKDLIEGNLKKILRSFEDMAENGIDFKDFRERILRYFQNKLLVNLGVNTGDKCNLPVARLNIWLNLLINVARQEKDTEIGQLPLELAVVEFLGDREETGNEKLETRTESKEEETIEPEVENTLSIQVQDVEAVWGKLLIAVKPYNHSLEAFLRAARPYKIQGSDVVLEVFYPFHKDKLEEEKNRKIMEKVLKEVLGVKANFRCILGKNKKLPLVIDNNTPVDEVTDKKDIYDVAKEIFG